MVNALNHARTSHEMMTLLVSDDEAKALTRQITGHKDLLSSRDAHIQAMRKSIPELDESVTNAIEIRQIQQAEFVTAVYRKCSRHQSGRHIRAKPRATRPMIQGRRAFSFVCARWCTDVDETSEALSCRTS